MLQEIKSWFVHQVKYYKREKSNMLEPLHIRKEEIFEKEKKYKKFVSDIISEMENLPEQEKKFIKGSELLQNYSILSFNGDRMGKVFLKDGEIYRGIYCSKEKDIETLWRTGLLQVLGKRGLIPKTELSSYYIDEYSVFLHHEKVEMVPSKLWNLEMVKDASILILILKEIAHQVGFTLHDGHLNNVTFHYGRPVFTDVGSFVINYGQKTVCNREIVFSGCYRLIFANLGNSIMARIQAYDEENNAIWLQPRFYNDLSREYHYALKCYCAYHRKHSNFLSNRLIRKMLYSYNLKPAEFDLVFNISSNSKEKMIDSQGLITDVLLVSDFLSETVLPISNAVDLGGSGGKMAEAFFDLYRKPIMTLDINDIVSNQTYNYYKEKNIIGNTLQLHYLYGYDYTSAKAINADLVIALDITNNIVSYQQYHLDSLFNSLKKLTNLYCLITYHPQECKNSNYIHSAQEENDEEVVKQCFKQFFELIYFKIFDESGQLIYLFLGKTSD